MILACDGILIETFCLEKRMNNILLLYLFSFPDLWKNEGNRSNMCSYLGITDTMIWGFLLRIYQPYNVIEVKLFLCFRYHQFIKILSCYVQLNNVTCYILLIPFGRCSILHKKNKNHNRKKTCIECIDINISWFC